MQLATLPPAVILAGGLGKRLGGRDKALISLAGRPLLAHAVDRLRPQTGPILLSANGDPGRFAGFGLPVVADTLPDYQGPLAGVIAAMVWLDAEGIPGRHVLSVSVDTPFLPADLVERFAGRAAYARSEDRPHPTVALWPREGLDRLTDLVMGGNRRVRAALDLFGAVAVDWDSPDPFFNINTPDDLAWAEARLLEAG